MIMAMMLRNLSTTVLDKPKKKRLKQVPEATDVDDPRVKKLYKKIKKSLRKKLGERLLSLHPEFP